MTLVEVGSLREYNHWLMVQIEKFFHTVGNPEISLSKGDWSTVTRCTALKWATKHRSDISNGDFVFVQFCCCASYRRVLFLDKLEGLVLDIAFRFYSLPMVNASKESLELFAGGILVQTMK